MAEGPPRAPDTMTLARFIEEAATASGGMEALSRRMGLSRPAVERMSSSDQPLLADDAAALFEAFGLSVGSASDAGRTER